MMILAIDCGNTLTTVGCVDADRNVRAIFRIPTDRKETDIGYASELLQALSLLKVDREELSGAAISCVVPSLTDVFVRAVTYVLGNDRKPLVIGAGIKSGLPLRINDPGTVASDLVISAVAAKSDYALPCIVVDFGTATTVSALDRDGRFIGCAILPGAELSLSALSNGTALLPHVEIRAPKSPIGTCTADCMRSGIVFGTAGAVDGLLERFAEAMEDTPISLVATGGLAEYIAPHCRHTLPVDETLALRGLRIIWDKNQK